MQNLYCNANLKYDSSSLSGIWIVRFLKSGQIVDPLIKNNDASSYYFSLRFSEYIIDSLPGAISRTRWHHPGVIWNGGPLKYYISLFSLQYSFGAVSFYYRNIGILVIWRRQYLRTYPQIGHELLEKILVTADDDQEELEFSVNISAKF